MADEVDEVMAGVRLDTAALRREVAAASSAIEDPIVDAAETAARGLESALLRAVRTGKLGFDDLQAAALSALNQIAAAAVKRGLESLLGGGGSSGGGGGGSSLASVLSGLLGSPGRATGGPVSPGSAYVVGERGPELFVPTSSGRVETGTATGAARDVRVAITVNASASASAGALAQSSRQVARAVKAALDAG